MQQRHPLAHWPAQRRHAPPCHARIHFRSAPQKFIALVSIVVWSVYSVCPGSKRGGLLPTQPAHDAWMRGTGCGVCALNPQPTSCPFQWALLHSQSAAVCSIAPPSLVGKRKKSSLTGAPILEHSLPPPSSFLMPHIPAQKKMFVCSQPNFFRRPPAWPSSRSRRSMGTSHSPSRCLCPAPASSPSNHTRQDRRSRLLSAPDAESACRCRTETRTTPRRLIHSHVHVPSLSYICSPHE